MKNGLAQRTARVGTTERKRNYHRYRTSINFSFRITYCRYVLRAGGARSRSRIKSYVIDYAENGVGSGASALEVDPRRVLSFLAILLLIGKIRERTEIVSVSVQLRIAELASRLEELTSPR